MPSKYDQYRVRNGDQIGDPEYWNAPRFKDIDLRLNTLEDQKTTLDAVIEEGRTVFRARVDDILLPLVQEVFDIAQVGVMLRAHSSTEIEIAPGGKTLFIDASEKDRFAAPAYVSVMADGDPSRAMFGSVLSYSLETGELVIDVDRYIGAGNGADWIVTVANTTDGANDAARAENAASAAVQYRNQSEAHKIAAEGAAATATAQSAAAVAANSQAQAAKNDAQTYRGDVISAISSWTSSVLPPSAVNPSQRPGGAALQVGDQFFKTSDNLWRTWSGSQWTVNAVPSGSSVASVFGRTGAVDAQANDYRGDQVARTTAQQSIITGTTVEAALQTLKSLLSAETTNRTTAISTAVAPKADKTTTISPSGLATGGGDLSANRTITVPKSTQAQAAAGADDSTAMTPLRTKDAIDALVPAASETLSGKVRLATSAETQSGVATNLAVHPAGLKAAIDTRISGIINGSPAALDTLAELASALGNDANFSATVTSALASKAPLNGAGVSGTWGISITGTAQFANGAAWNTITGRPTTLSAFSNDSGFITTAGRAFPKKADGGDFNLNWSGQAGQPTWLVGSDDGVNFFVWNPSNFSVNYATSAGYAVNAGYANSSGYATTAGSAETANTATNVVNPPTQLLWEGSVAGLGSLDLPSIFAGYRSYIIEYSNLNNSANSNTACMQLYAEGIGWVTTTSYSGKLEGGNSVGFTGSMWGGAQQTDHAELVMRGRVWASSLNVQSGARGFCRVMFPHVTSQWTQMEIMATCMDVSIGDAYINSYGGGNVRLTNNITGFRIYMESGGTFANGYVRVYGEQK